MSTFEILPGIEGVPVPRGPFSLGIVADGPFLFMAGQGPFEPARGTYSRGSIAQQTRLTLECVRRVLREAGAGVSDIIQCRVYLQPLNDSTFAEMNAEYAKFFGSHRPARTTIGAQLLGIDVEIDCVARVRR